MFVHVLLFLRSMVVTYVGEVKCDGQSTRDHQLFDKYCDFRGKLVTYVGEAECEGPHSRDHLPYKFDTYIDPSKAS